MEPEWHKWAPTGPKVDPEDQKETPQRAREEEQEADKEGGGGRARRSEKEEG